MSCVIKEVFYSEDFPPYFQTWVTIFPDNESLLQIQEIFHEPNVSCSIVVNEMVIK